MVNFSITILLFLLFCALFQFQPATLDEVGVQSDAQKPLFSKVLMDTVSLLRKSHKSSWDKIKTVIKDLQMQFSPPSLDFRSGGGRVGVEDPKETLKEAFKKSIDKSKETFEESAKSTGKAVETAVRKTTTEHKKTTHDSENESKAEL
ncbi:uncharacterized protein LOC124826281 [Vigna umbellata]|uniref:uncharacterized protein LOC124826281 n=1 Tax=Vigna umbellata TaxID=87088 RepID=UPI001F5E7338|nr:uncharacterized protein LOC124826281 [Vigna umbellata]